MGWKDTIKPTEAEDKKSSWRDTISADTPEDTPAGAPVNLSAPAPESGIWGLDSGVRVSKDQIDSLAKKHNVDPGVLERQAVRHGATYPDSTSGEKAFAQLYSKGDTLLANAPSWIQKKIVGFAEGGNTEEALDDLREGIEKGKSGAQKTAEFVTGVASPLRLPGALAAKLPAGKTLATGKYANAAATGGVMAGVAGATHSRDGEALGDTVNAATIGAGAGPLLQKGLEAGAKGVAKVLGRGDVADAYLADRSRYNDPELTVDNVNAKATDQLHGLKDGIDTAQTAFDDASSGVKEARNLIKERSGQEHQGAKDGLAIAMQKYTALRDQVAAAEKAGRSEAKGQLDTLLQQAKADLADALAARKAPTLPEDLPGRVKDLTKAQRTATSKSSSESWDILNNSGDTVDISDLRTWVDGRTNPKMVMGVEVPQSETPELAALKKWSSVLDQAETNQSPAQLKELVQGIQADLKNAYSQGAGGYVNKDQSALRDFEGSVQGILKSKLDVSEEFAAKMAETSQNTKLATAGRKTFGGDKDILNTLRNLNSPGAADRRGLLNDLSQRHDPSVSNDLDAYFQAASEFNSPASKRAVHQSVMDDLIDPTTGQKADISGLRQRISAPSQIEAKVGASEQARLLQEAEDAVLPYQKHPDWDPRKAIENELSESADMSKLIDAQARLDAAKEGAAPVSRMLKKDKLDAEEVIRAVMNSTAKKPNTAQREVLAHLSETGGMGDDLVKSADDLKIKNAFLDRGPNGSRLVNIGSNVGGWVGSKVGSPRMGRALGALGGGAMDYSGGKVAKAALDASAVGTPGALKATQAIIYTNIDKLVGSSDPKAKRYLQALDSASQRGPEALAVTHSMLERDPDFKALTGGVE